MNSRDIVLLDDDTYERPDASKVVIQLRKALEYQVSVVSVFLKVTGFGFLPIQVIFLVPKLLIYMYLKFKSQKERLIHLTITNNNKT